MTPQNQSFAPHYFKPAKQFTPEAYASNLKERLTAALEIQKALMGNMDGLLNAVRSMTTEDAQKWIIKVDSVSLLFDGFGATRPAAADTASRFTKSAAEALAPRTFNTKGSTGHAMPYPTGLNEDLKRCAQALHEITEVISELAVDDVLMAA